MCIKGLPEDEKSSPAREILNSIQKYVWEILLRYKFSKKAKKTREGNYAIRIFISISSLFHQNLSFILHDFFLKDFLKIQRKQVEKL